jgi:hypothetical protein
MNRRTQLLASLLVAFASVSFTVGCGSSSHNGGGGFNNTTTTASGNGTVGFSAFTVNPTTLKEGSTSTFNFTVTNTGSSASSSTTVQAYLSSQQITTQNYTSSNVTAIGSPFGLSSVNGGTSSSGTITAVVSSPNIHAPATAFVALVAIPSASATQPYITSNTQVQLQ